MDFHIDRGVWPRSDNSVVASRYHSSADKAAGVGGPPAATSSRTNNPTEAEKRRRSQWKRTGCERGHSTGRYLYVCA
ncbi:unnamed protein product, partial [Tenebrio molitor]